MDKILQVLNTISVCGADNLNKLLWCIQQLEKETGCNDGGQND